MILVKSGAVELGRVMLPVGDCGLVKSEQSSVPHVYNASHVHIALDPLWVVGDEVSPEDTTQRVTH